MSVIRSARSFTAFAERWLSHSHRHPAFQLLFVSWRLKPVFLTLDQTCLQSVESKEARKRPGALGPFIALVCALSPCTPLSYS